MVLSLPPEASRFPSFENTSDLTACRLHHEYGRSAERRCTYSIMTPDRLANHTPCVYLYLEEYNRVVITAYRQNPVVVVW
jgi:hypothetical protein